MTIKTMSVLAAVLAAGMVQAQDEAPEAEKDESKAAVAAKDAAQNVFTTLPCCSFAEGQAEVLLPGASEWKAAEEGKFYPLGASYRTRGADSKLVVTFGPESRATIVGDSTFGTRVQPLGEKSRTIVAGAGTLTLDLARNLAEGLFSVTAPGFTLKNPAGESKFVLTEKPDGTESVVRCVTGTLGIEGRHYDIPQMRAADEIRIRNTTDNLETLLYGTSGDYIVKIDRGVVTTPKVDADGQVTTETHDAKLDWHLSPKTKVRICRLVPSIGQRMSVAVMTFDAVGEMKNNFAYSEGRAEVNTGELVKQTAEGSDDSAKKAAAAEETTTAAAADDDAEESEDSKKDNNNKDE